MRAFCHSLLMGGALACALVAPAAAQQPNRCAPLESVQRTLLADYGEKPVGMGRLEDDVNVVLFLNPDKGTFTIVGVRGVMACLMTGGDEWRAIVQKPGAPS